MCYHAKFGLSASKGVGTSRGTPKIGAHWTPSFAIGTCLTPYKHASHPSPCGLPTQEWIAVGQTVGKTGPLVSCLSRSVKVVRIETDRLGTYDFRIDVP